MQAVHPLEVRVVAAQPVAAVLAQDDEQHIELVAQRRLSLTYLKSFNDVDLKAKFAVYNVFNQQRTLQVNERYETALGFPNPAYLRGASFQSPRYAQLQVTVDF